MQPGKPAEISFIQKMKKIYHVLEHCSMKLIYLKNHRSSINIEKLSMITFLCHGNICRSAFCENYVKKFDLGNSVTFNSCGLHADESNKTPEVSSSSAKRFGVDLSNHVPRRISRSLVEESSIIFGMDYRNYFDFRKEFPEYVSKFYLLKEVGFFDKYGIVRDPYGGTEEDYIRCYDTLIDYLTILLNKLSNSKSRSKDNLMIVTGALSYGGLERVVIDLAKNVSSRYNPYTICIHNKGEQAKELTSNMLPVVPLNERKKRLTNYTSFLKIRKIIIEENIKVVHTHNTGPLLSSALAVAFLKRKPVFIHTDHARKYPDKARYMIGEKLASYLVDKIIAVSEETKENLIRFEKISPSKIDIINNGINKAKYDIQIDKEMKLREIGVEGFDYHIGLGVVLTEQKGIRYLIDAMPCILQIYPRTALIIAGDGPIRRDLEEQVSVKGLKYNTFFLGMRDDIPDLLQLLDIYVLPSEWEGLPLVILEAMAAKRCILTTNVGGIPIAIRSGHNGILVPPKDSDALSKAITTLLADKQYRDNLALRAYDDFINNFSVDKMVSSYEQYYSVFLDKLT